MTSARPSRRRVVLERSWIGISLLYACVRITLVSEFLSAYGVNPRMFAVVELSSAIPYSLGTARVVGALADRRRDLALKWGFVAGLGFLAPDLYVLLHTHRAPKTLYFAVSMWIVLAALLAVRTVRKRTAARRQAAC